MHIYNAIQRLSTSMKLVYYTIIPAEICATSRDSEMVWPLGLKKGSYTFIKTDAQYEKPCSMFLITRNQPCLRVIKNYQQCCHLKTAEHMWCKTTNTQTTISCTGEFSNFRRQHTGCKSRFTASLQNIGMDGSIENMVHENHTWHKKVAGISKLYI